MASGTTPLVTPTTIDGTPAGKGTGSDVSVVANTMVLSPSTNMGAVSTPGTGVLAAVLTYSL